MIYRFNTICIKFPTAIFAEMEKSILKLIQNFKELKLAKKSWKENQTGEFSNFVLPNFKIFYKGTVIKTMRYIDIHTDKWNRWESEINPYIWPTDFWQWFKPIQWKRYSLHNIWYLEIRCPHAKNEVDPISLNIKN